MPGLMRGGELELKDQSNLEKQEPLEFRTNFIERQALYAYSASLAASFWGHRVAWYPTGLGVL